jgi:hypothetical protein
MPRSAIVRRRVAGISAGLLQLGVEELQVRDAEEV